MNRKTYSRPSTLAFGVLVATIAATRLATGQTQKPSEEWQVTIAPYIWGAAMDGSMVIQGREAQVDVSASDIFHHLDAGFMSMAAARKGNWGFGGDIVYVNLGISTDMPPADVDPSLGLFTFQGLWRMSDFAELTFGLRYNRLDGQIDFDAPINMEVEKTRDWIDPIVGVVLRTPEGHRWHATLIADVGGFGVGSDLTWQLFPSGGFKMSKHSSMEFGWRFLDTDYQTGEGSERFEYDMLLEGPVVGLAFRF